MGIIPFLEGGFGYAYWGLPEIDTKITIFVDLIILSQGLLIFQLANFKHKNILAFPKPRNIWLLCIFQLCMASYVLYKFDFNLFNLLLRIGEFKGNYSSQLDYLFLTFIRILIFNIGFFIYVSNARFGFLFLIISILMLSPFSMSRALTGAIYLSVIFYVLSLKYNRINFHKTLVMASMLLFPLFDIFRQFDSERNISEYVTKDVLLNGQYDSHQIIVAVISDQLFLWGSNIVGALLFFVPRSIWDSKPVSSGRFIPDHYDLILNNISAPFVVEMVLAFGLLGLLLTPFIYSKLILITNNLSLKNSLLSFQLAALSVMMLRGSLMTTASFLFCIIFSWFFISTITRLR
ncbi:hypothetical protein OAN77_00565 [bacterium]|nr:hypothetical protein [bacterium]